VPLTSSPNPFVFVVGCPRSGTTLVQRMLDAHRDLAIINETLWIDRFFSERKGVTPEGYVTPAFVSNLFDFKWFARLPVEREDVERLVDEDGPVHYTTFVSRIFDLYGRARGKRLVGDKSPRYVRDLPLFHELFPRARFVHVIRDGRSTCLSILNWGKDAKLARRLPTWREHPLVTAALWWEWFVRLGREAGASLGPTLYYEISYEALVAEPAKELERLCSFLGLPFDEAMLRFHEGRQRSEHGLSAKEAWLPPIPGLRDWRTQMAAEEIEQFEAAAGGLLGELGYPRAFPEPAADAQELAARLRRAFAHGRRVRGRHVPKRWQLSPTASRTARRAAREEDGSYVFRQ
jgi:hypothetical protein